jgi:hypothetical protein
LFSISKVKDIVYIHIATVRGEANHDRLNATAYRQSPQSTAAAATTSRIAAAVAGLRIWGNIRLRW